MPRKSKPFFEQNIETFTAAGLIQPTGRQLLQFDAFQQKIRHPNSPLPAIIGN